MNYWFLIIIMDAEQHRHPHINYTQAFILEWSKWNSQISLIYNQIAKCTLVVILQVFPNLLIGQGGGSFIYCELAKANQRFADEIEQVLTPDELAVIWKKKCKKQFS